MKFWISLLCYFGSFAFLSAQTLIRSIPNAHSERINALAISDDGKSVFSAGDDYVVKTWDVEAGENLAKLKGNNDQVWDLIAQGDYLVSAGREPEIFVWNSWNFKLEKKLTEHDYHVEDLDFCTEKGLLASASRDNSVKVWDLIANSSVQTLKGHESDVKALSFSSDGKWIATFSGKKVLRIWDVQSQKIIKKLKGSESVGKLDFSPDGQFLLATVGKNIIVWETKNWSVKYRLRGHTAEIYDLKFIPDAQYFASCGADGKVIFWNVDSGKVVYSFVSNERSEVSALAFDKAGKILATAGLDKTIKIWENPILKMQKQQRFFEGNQN